MTESEFAVGKGDQFEWQCGSVVTVTDRWVDEDGNVQLTVKEDGRKTSITPDDIRHQIENDSLSRFGGDEDD